MFTVLELEALTSSYGMKWMIESEDEVYLILMLVLTVLLIERCDQGGIRYCMRWF